MSIAHQKIVQPTILAFVLFVSAAGWVAGLCGWFWKGLQSKDGFSGTPLTCMLLLCLSPVVCAIFSFVLVRARRKSDFTVFEWLALAAGGVPIVAMILVLLLMVVALILSRR